MVDVEELIEEARDAIAVKRVFGDAYEKNGTTVIPTARVMGGGGAGTGHDQEGKAAGTGTGFGLRASPAGVYVIKGEEVRWIPAIDVNRLLLGMQALAVVALLVARSIARAQISRDHARGRARA